MLLKIYTIFSHGFGIWNFSDCQESFLEFGELFQSIASRFFSNKMNFSILARNFFSILFFPPGSLVCECYVLQSAHFSVISISL